MRRESYNRSNSPCCYRSAGRPIFLALEHIPVGLSGRVAGDINLVFRVHASVAGLFVDLPFVYYQVFLD